MWQVSLVGFAFTALHGHLHARLFRQLGTHYDVRHTHSVLRDYGNLSSGSFLFSLSRLLVEGRVRRGDYGVLMTMGPGSTIETALVRW